MDTAGARHLVARLQAGVGVGAAIQLTSNGPPNSLLVPGDVGVVEDFREDGNLVVRWERGFTYEIHPSLVDYRAFGVTSLEPEPN